MIKPIKERSIKVILIGDYAVGKTSVRRNYMGETFQTNYLPTIGCDFSFKRLQLDDKGETIKILIWDLAGDASFKKIHSQFYKGAHGAIIMYDVTSRTSFLHVKDWVKTFYQEIHPYRPPIVIVGNKIDLLSNKTSQNQPQKDASTNENNTTDYITQEEEHALVKEIIELYGNNIIIFSTRTSAKTGVNIDVMFRKTVSNILRWLQRTKFDYMKTLIRSKSIDQLIPFANIFIFHEVMGPVNIIYSPLKNMSVNLKPNEFINEGIKIFAIYDFDHISQRRVIHGFHNWSKPEGNYLYIIFSIANEQARAKEELHIIGVHLSQLLSDVLSYIEPIILGYLFHFMNQYVYLLESYNFRGAHLKKVTLPDELKERVLRELDNLRQQIYTQLLTLF